MKYAQAFKNVALPFHRYGYSLINYDKTCFDIISKLNLKYAEDLTIVDMYSGLNGFSFALNEQLQPKKHILLENHAQTHQYLQDLLAEVPGETSFHLSNLSSFDWGSYTQLEETKVIDVPKHTRDEIHPNLLIHGNLRYPRGEPLLMQFYSCLQEKNWLQKYGRARMLLWVTDKTAAKVVPKPKKKRMGYIAEKYSDTRLVAYSEKSSLKDEAALCFKHEDEICLLEIVPKVVDTTLLNEWNVVSKKICNFGTAKVSSAVGTLGAGAPEYFMEVLPKEILDTKIQDMTIDQLDIIVEKYWRWPFKPQEALEYMENTNSFY